MIPIPPLDGSHILFAILPQRFERWKENFFRVGSILLIVIIMIENRTDLDILPIGKMAATVYKGFFHVLHIE
jgi:Zn-dependent protease